MRSSRSWMYNRLDERGLISDKFAEGVQEFVKFAFGPRGTSIEGLTVCPCTRCKNAYYFDENKIYMHILRNGFTPDYNIWREHGESINYYGRDNNVNVVGESSIMGGGDATVRNENPIDDLVRDMFPDINLDGSDFELGEEPNPRAKKFFEMYAKAQEPICPGHPTSLLQWASEIAGIKTANRATGMVGDGLVRVGHISVDPKYKDTLPQKWKDVKKLMLHLGLSVRTYDFCINHCFLYYKEGLHLDSCPTCGTSRYEDRIGKGKRVAMRKVWFFPLTERLQRLYLSRKTAEHMTWHTKCKRRADPVIHPGGSEQWAHFEETYPDFADEPRNVRLGLCADGFDPNHGSTSDPHSCWPVFITPYNLPPDLCMRPEFIFLTLLIQGKKDPGINIDVMLRPVVDELKDLWEHGALTYDSLRKENFIMRAALTNGTINDFPAYGMLSGWSTHGKMACPCCMQNTDSFQLQHSRKATWFDCHRKFLPPGHRERRNKDDYIQGRTVSRLVPERMPIDRIVRQVASLPEVTFGNLNYVPPAGKGEMHNWTKRSIFWELVYWPVLFVRHNLDVMHTEKNCFVQVHVTTFDLGSKSKDNIASRKDLALLTNRTELFLLSDDSKSKPKATYTLDPERLQAVCEWIKTLRFPDGHCSNLGGKIKSKPWRITKMKSHDCHIFMQRLLPIAFRDLVPLPIWEALAELSNFFRAICASEVSPSEMFKLGHSIVQTLCKLEKIFPPAFFNSMEHILVHLPFEAMVLGPVFYRWMYPFERMMWLLKNHYFNNNHIEGSIAQAYLMREVSNFAKMYIGDEITRGRRNEMPAFAPEFVGQNPIFTPVGFPCGKGRDKILTDEDHRAVILYVVRNCPELDPYVRMFDAQFGGSMTDKQLEVFRVSNLVSWLHNAHYNNQIRLDVRLLAITFGGHPRVTTYDQYVCNGYRWHTYDYGLGRKTMCSGVSISASGTTYHGMLREIVEVSFYSDSLPEQKIVMFKCDWYDPSPRGTTVHPKYGFVDINSRRLYGTKEKFIFASQAQQVYYATYPVSLLPAGKCKRKGIWAVIPARARHMIDLSSVTGDKENPEDYFEDTTPPTMNDPIDDLTTFNVLDMLAEDMIIDVDELERFEDESGDDYSEDDEEAEFVI